MKVYPWCQGHFTSIAAARCVTFTLLTDTGFAMKSNPDALTEIVNIVLQNLQPLGKAAE